MKLNGLLKMVARSKICSILSLTALLVIASAIFTNAHAADNLVFNTATASKTVNKAIRELSSNKTDSEQLQYYVNNILQLQNEAKECVQITDKQLTKIADGLKELKINTKNENKLTTAQRYFRKKHSTLISQRSECKLFILHSEETVRMLNDKLNDIKTKKLLTTQQHFIATLPVVKNIVINFPEGFSKKHF